VAGSMGIAAGAVPGWPCANAQAPAAAATATTLELPTPCRAAASAVATPPVTVDEAVLLEDVAPDMCCVVEDLEEEVNGAGCGAEEEEEVAQVDEAESGSRARAEAAQPAEPAATSVEEAPPSRSSSANEPEVAEAPTEPEVAEAPKAPKAPLLRRRRTWPLRVGFDDEVSVHSITPYAEIYGMHPRYFDFDKGFSMVPACGFGAARLVPAALERLDTDAEDDELSSEDDFSDFDGDDTEHRELRDVSDGAQVAPFVEACCGNLTSEASAAVITEVC